MTLAAMSPVSLTHSTECWRRRGALALGALPAGIANTLVWNYWTLAYLRLRGAAPAAS